MKKLFFALLACGALTAQAQLEYRQIGTIKTDDYKFRSSYYPVYTMSKFGEGITIYPSNFLSMPPGTLIKEITYFGYQTAAKAKDLKYTVYVGNTSLTAVNTLIIPGPDEGSKTTTVIDVSGMTKFCELTLNGLAQKGSASEAEEILTFTSPEGFVYDGDNLVIYIALNDGCSRSAVESPYTTFFTANNGGESKCIGGYRNSEYGTTDYNGGYGINTKPWTFNTAADVHLPVIKIGYEGAKVQIDATVTGRVVSSRNHIGIEGATVTVGNQSVTTAASGQYEIFIENVDASATYTLTASSAGYETATQTVDLRAGGVVALDDIVLTKQPVPAVLRGRVVSREGYAAVEKATVTFAGQTSVSAVDGSYSISVANIDDLPADGSTLSAAARGFLPYRTTMSIAGDTDFDIVMEALPALEGEGSLIGEWDIESYDYKAPFNPLWNHSEAHVIYPASMFEGVAVGTKFSSLCFYGYYPEPTPGGGYSEGDGDNDYGTYESLHRQHSRRFSVCVAIGSTDRSAFDRNSIEPLDHSTMTRMFDGEVTVNPCGDASHPARLISLDFAEPFTYDGGGVALSVRAGAPVATLLYFCQDKALGSNVIARCGSGELSDVAFNINQGVPVMRLGSYVPTARLSGRVTSVSDGLPIEGVAVTISGHGASVSTTTDVGGMYDISLRNVTLGVTYVVNFSLAAYYDETFDITFTANELNVTKDVGMEKVNTGIEQATADRYRGPVYSVAGVRVLDEPSPESIGSLPRGIYFCSGRKIAVK